MVAIKLRQQVGMILYGETVYVPYSADLSAREHMQLALDQAGSATSPRAWTLSTYYGDEHEDNTRIPPSELDKPLPLPLDAQGQPEWKTTYFFLMEYRP